VYVDLQGPTNICSHITTHPFISFGYFNNCNFSKHEYCASWLWCDCTETCWSCFNVNFTVDFKIVFKTVHLCISWWIKNFYSIKMHGMYVKKNSTIWWIIILLVGITHNFCKGTNVRWAAHK